jgi:hypothetical protein
MDCLTRLDISQLTNNYSCSFLALMGLAKIGVLRHEVAEGVVSTHQGRRPSMLLDEPRIMNKGADLTM